MFPVPNRSNRYFAKAKVLGIIVDGHSKAYPFKEYRKSLIRGRHAAVPHKIQRKFRLTSEIHVHKEASLVMN